MRSLPVRALAFVAFSSMIAAVSACGGLANPARVPGAGGSGPGEVGRLAPALSIQSLNGKGAVSLTSLSGKIAIVDFWATWCEPCKASFPKLEKLAKQSGVEVVGISVDDTRDGVAAFAKAQGASFPIGWDENHTLARRWSVQKTPTTYILDGTGTVRFMHEASRDDGDLIAREIAQLANEPSASKAEVASAPPAAPAAPPSPVVAAAAPSAPEETPEPLSDVAPTTKPKAKPAAGKKSAPKKKKKTSAASTSSRGRASRDRASSSPLALASARWRSGRTPS